VERKTGRKFWVSSIITGPGLLLSLFAFNNCDNVKLTKLDSLQQSSVAIPENKLTLAVRGGSCLMCHAVVHGDLITDFGFGQSYFMTRRKYSMNGDWNNGSITGNVIVPKILVTRDGLGRPVPTPQSIKDFLAQVIPLTASADLNIPGIRGSIVERSEIFIGAPNEDVIMNLTRRSDAKLVFEDWDVSIFKVGDLAQISGLVSKQSQTGADYFTNGPDGIKCTGDIIILGPVLLNEANISTDSTDGCRLYVQKSVFVKGAITYNGSTGETPNLQISSARTIMMGIKGAKTRLEDSADGFAGIRQASSVDAEKTFNQKIYDDRDTMIEGLEEAGPWRACMSPGSSRYIGSFDTGTPTEHWEYLDNKNHEVATYDCSGDDWTLRVSAALKSSTTRTVNYTGLYLNAPKVHSRYLGVFKGVVVAEDAIFALQEFEFQNDTTFNHVPVLPLLQGRVLRVSDN
jgi:hypothetical protein